MGASRHINPKQLKLFMTADELMNSTSGDVMAEYDYVDITNPSIRTLAQDTTLNKQKLKESMSGSENEAVDEPQKGETTLFDSIKNHGVLTPVMVEHQDDGGVILHNGHHRVSVANELNPQMYIPIRYSEDGYDTDAWDETSAEVDPEVKKKAKRINKR